METGLGKRIKKRRLDLNLTQEDLALRMGYKSKAAICKVEGGEDNITSDRIRKFADALETTPSYLMGWESELPKAATGHSPATSVIVEPDYDPEYIKNATDIYNQIMSAPPEIQAAISTLLKSQRHDS